MTDQQPTALRLADYWRRRAAELQVWIDDGEGVEFGYRHEGLLKEQAKFLETADRIAALEEALGMAVEALEHGLDYAKSEQYANARRFEGYERLAPDDATSVKLIEEALATARQTLGGAA